MQMQIPSADEQQKIADILSTLDRKINAVEGQITEVGTF